MLDNSRLAAIPFDAPSPVDDGALDRRDSPLRKRVGAGTKSVRLVHLGAASALLAARLPASEQELSAMLVRQGVVPAPIDLRGLAQLYRTAGSPAPFRSLDCAGMTIAVAPSAHAISRQIGTVAVRLVQYWGLAAVSTVASRVSALSSSPVSDVSAGRLLAAMSRISWLDGDRRRWFSFTGDTGRFEVTLRKIFAVAGAVPIGELGAALARALPGVHEAPPRVLERRLCETGRCTIDAGVVRRAEPDAATALTPQERVLVDLLEAAGGTLEALVLRLRAIAAGVPKTTVNQILRLSPLFVSCRLSCRLSSRLSSAVPLVPAFRLVGRAPGPACE